MNKILINLTIIVSLAGCSKELINDLPSSSQPRIVTDSLIIYQSSNLTGNRGIFSKSFATKDSILLVANATSPYVASQRMVYIKAGKTLGYAKLDGISRFLIDLNAPANPCLSIDARLISVVDKTEDQYQLLVIDTFLNKTLLYQSSLEIKEPEFSTDGKFIYFSHKSNDGRFTIYSISSSGGMPLAIMQSAPDVDYTDCASTSDRLYFLQTRTISGKLSTEICSVNLSGTDFKQQTNFTLDWSQYSFKIENLRKVNNSTLIFISEFGSTNKEIYVAKADNLTSHTRITYSDTYESYPNLIPDFVKDF